MELQFILARFIFILFMSCRKFSRGVYISLIKFGLNIHGKKGVHQNGFFIYFGGSKHLVYIS